MNLLSASFLCASFDNLCVMHEDAPKMSVEQSLAASSGEPQSDIVLEVPNEFDMSSTEEMQTECINLDLTIAYVEPTSGK